MSDTVEETEATTVDVLVLANVTVHVTGSGEQTPREYAVAFVRSALHRAADGECAIGIPDPLGVLSAGVVTTDEEPPVHLDSLISQFKDAREDGAGAVGVHLDESVRMGGTEDESLDLAVAALASLLVHGSRALDHVNGLQKERVQP